MTRTVLLRRIKTWPAPRKVLFPEVWLLSLCRNGECRDRNTRRSLLDGNQGLRLMSESGQKPRQPVHGNVTERGHGVTLCA